MKHKRFNIIIPNLEIIHQDDAQNCDSDINIPSSQIYK
jgi:hypothetical protein